MIFLRNFLKKKPSEKKSSDLEGPQDWYEKLNCEPKAPDGFNRVHLGYIDSDVGRIEIQVSDIDEAVKDLRQEGIINDKRSLVIYGYVDVPEEFTI